MKPMRVFWWICKIVAALAIVAGLVVAVIEIKKYLAEPAPAHLEIIETGAFSLLDPFPVGPGLLKIDWDRARGIGTPRWEPVSRLNLVYINFRNSGGTTLEPPPSGRHLAVISVKGGEILFSGPANDGNKESRVEFEVTRQPDGRSTLVTWGFLNAGDSFTIAFYHNAEKPQRYELDSPRIPGHPDVSLLHRSHLMPVSTFSRWHFVVFPVTLLVVSVVAFYPRLLRQFGVDRLSRARRSGLSLMILIQALFLGTFFQMLFGSSGFSVGIGLMPGLVFAFAALFPIVPIFIAVAGSRRNSAQQGKEGAN